MRASRQILRWASPFSSPASQSWRAISNKSYIRRHAFLPISQVLRSSPGQIRAFSACRPAQFMLDGDSTIYALSTATGRAAIAVIRVSGPACASVCISRKSKPAPCSIGHQANNSLLDIQKPLPEYPAPKTTLCIPPHSLRPNPTPIPQHNPRRRRPRSLLPRSPNSNRRRYPRTPRPWRPRNNQSRPLGHRTNKHSRTGRSIRRTRRVYPARIHE